MTQAQEPEPQAEPEASQQELLPQLTAILTARWRQENGRLAIGAPRRRLLQALRVEEARVDELLAALAEKAGELGLELREYRRAGDMWVCLTAVHGGPTELTDEEQGVLGVVVHLVRASGRRRHTTVDDLRELLVGREYLTEHQLQSRLRRLEYLGYIRRSRGTVHLDCRSELEFDENARREIAEQARSLIL
ncbi:MAG: hypothetical protein ACLF0G_13840 [Candidatus Brocadiia bacterium]